MPPPQGCCILAPEKRTYGELRLSESGGGDAKGACGRPCIQHQGDTEPSERRGHTRSLDSCLPRAQRHRLHLRRPLRPADTRRQGRAELRRHREDVGRNGLRAGVRHTDALARPAVQLRRGLEGREDHRNRSKDLPRRQRGVLRAALVRIRRQAARALRRRGLRRAEGHTFRRPSALQGGKRPVRGGDLPGPLVSRAPELMGRAGRRTADHQPFRQQRGAHEA